jgi:hypothetical protein
MAVDVCVRGEDLGKGSTSEGIVSDHDLLGVAENHMLLQDLASHHVASLPRM